MSPDISPDDYVPNASVTPPSLMLRIKEEQILDGPDFNYETIGKLMDDGMWTFRLLDPEETKEFQQAARDNYQAFQPIEGIWHPIYQLECVVINHEHSLYRKPTEEQLDEEDEQIVALYEADREAEE